MNPATTAQNTTGSHTSYTWNLFWILSLNGINLNII